MNELLPVTYLLWAPWNFLIYILLLLSFIMTILYASISFKAFNYFVLLLATNPGPKVVEVCASYSSTDSTCLWNADITVRWCQENTSANREYFVYQLKRTPFCSMAYCAGDGIACQQNCSWNGIRKSCSC